MSKFDELREAISGINQGSVQRALYLVLELLEHPDCSCKAVLDVQEMYPENPAIPRNPTDSET